MEFDICGRLWYSNRWSHAIKTVTSDLRRELPITPIEYAEGYVGVEPCREIVRKCDFRRVAEL